jgi:hypothetical protein
MLSTLANLTHCLATMARMAQRLQILPGVRATITLSNNVIHIRGRHHPTSLATHHTQRMSTQEHQTQAPPTVTIPPLICRATPLIIRPVFSLAHWPALVARPIAYHASTAWLIAPTPRLDQHAPYFKRRLFPALDKKPDIEFIDTPADIRDKYQYYTEAKMEKLKSAGYSLKFHSLEEGISDYVKNHLDGNKFL